MEQQIIFVMGVSGSGKSTIGQLVAKEKDIPFFDADDFHPKDNVEKMKSGKPLNDNDRAPWLDRLNELAIAEQAKKGAVITCSALKEAYRVRLGKGVQPMPKWVFLDGDFDLILNRINQRKGHYMPASLLQSQFDALELPKEAIKIDINRKPMDIVQSILESI